MNKALNFEYDVDDDKLYLDDLLDYFVEEKKICDDIKIHIREYLYEYMECNICKFRNYEDDSFFEVCYECEKMICVECCELRTLYYCYIDDMTGLEIEGMSYYKHKDFCNNCLNNNKVDTYHEIYIDL